MAAGGRTRKILKGAEILFYMLLRPFQTIDRGGFLKFYFNEDENLTMSAKYFFRDGGKFFF